MKNENALPLNAMIVDDERDLCMLLSMILKQKNLNPSCVNCIADAKKAINQVNPSLLFLDNKLPDGYGINFISEVKKKSPYTIVMITAHNSSTDQNQAIQNGADYFISKPFSSVMIKNTIDQLL